MQTRISFIDLVSNTCFPLLAAEELGFFKTEGLDAHIEAITLTTKAISALREGSTDVYASGSVHAVLNSFPCWKGVKVIAALSQGIPWLLACRPRRRARRYEYPEGVADWCRPRTRCGAQAIADRVGT